MNKEQLLNLGLTEEQATAVAEQMKNYIPKSRFDEVNSAKKESERLLQERDKQLEELKSTAGASEELKAQLAKLQEDNEAQAKKYQEEMDTLKFTTEVKQLANGKFHDVDLVLNLLDRNSITKGEDGNFVGIDEQLKALAESKPFLAVPEQPQVTPQVNEFGGFVPKVGAGNVPQEQGTTEDTLLSIFGVKN